MSRLSHIRIGRNAIAVLLMSVLIISMSAPPAFTASKATGTQKYVEITEKPVKVGNYYYKECHSRDGYESWISRSKKKNSGYEKVLDDFIPRVFTNGKTLYYMRWGKNDSMILSKCSASGKNKKSLKKLKMEVDWQLRCDLVTIYKNNIYIAMDPYKEGFGTYRYNLSTRKISRAANDGISIRKGRYVLAAESFSTDGYGFSKNSLYKITSKGKLKKIRNLRNNVGAGAFVGKHIYYLEIIENMDDSFELKGPTKVKVYRYNIDGRKEKLINSFSINKDYFLYSYGKITSKYCDVYMGNMAGYRLNYKTGKKTKL